MTLIPMLYSINSKCVKLFCTIYSPLCNYIIILTPKYNKGYFEANETDEVSDFSPCFFGVGSVTHECDVKINLSTGEILQQGEKIDNMEDFYGCVDEDETWVIGCLILDDFQDKWDHPYYNS